MAQTIVIYKDEGTREFGLRCLEKFFEGEDVWFANAEAVIDGRVLGMAERRGFTPLAIEGAQPPDGGDWRLQLTVHGARPPEPLQRQIEQLYDCLSVEIAPCP